MSTQPDSTLNTTAEAPDKGVVCDAMVSPSEWDDSKFRHAYRPSNQRVALCGYDGPSTRKGEWSIPTNACPICLAVLPDFADLVNQRWIQG